VAAESVDIEPIILLNKTDLLADDAALQQLMALLLDSYPALGYRIIRTSIKSGGMEELHQALKGRTSVFVGQSGVGKSSLVNTLLPDADLRVGALSENTLKGTHTTTTAQLFHLPTGGTLIDSPGIREFGLWHMTKEQVEQGFIEFRDYLGTCKFRDCQHQQEPACAILKAADLGGISIDRLDSYRRIVQSLEEN
jgi:ribosome biogenesis GTPase